MNKGIINILLPLLTLVIGGLIGYMICGGTSMEHDHEATEIVSNASGEEIWTCSMHPQIRMSEPGICPICEMDLIPLDNSMGSDDPTVLQMSQEAVKLAQIETFIVGGSSSSNSDISNASSTIELDGTVELDERTVKSQTAHLSGRIESMAVTFEGQYVSAGQKIASIYSTELLAASQELLTAAQYNDRVEGLKDAAIQKLKNWKMSDHQINQILSSGKAIETVDIFADHSGYVLSKKRSQGDYVKQGQALYSLGSTSRVWLIFNVYESDMAKVKKGDKITFTTSTMPGKEFNANVTYINPMLNSQSRTASVRAEINNVNNHLKPGMLLNGKIAFRKEKTQSKVNLEVTVPNTAILWTGDLSVVYVQLPDSDVPSYQFREVRVLSRSAEFSTISEGLITGEEVVTHGAFAIDAAAQLNNNMSMMNRNVTVKKDVATDEVPSFIDDTPKAFKDQLEELVNSYIELKNALIETDPIAASLSADLLLKSLKDVDMTLVKGEGHIFWMDQMKAIESHGSIIMNTEDVEEQRNQFDFLSQSVIKSLKAFGTNEKTYYVQFCPMAKNNEGADWISTDSVIKNPHFGDKMMKCGSVKLELK
jgi:Cu(I)/Ag(I) efflux system membrane fusion protein